MECCKPEKVNSFAKIIDGSLCLEEVSNLPTKSEKIKTEVFNTEPFMKQNNVAFVYIHNAYKNFFSYLTKIHFYKIFFS